MPLPIDNRKRPASVRIHVSTNAGVDITWSDGHFSHYDFVYLREVCPCALCDDERRKKEAVASSSSAGTGAVALPMFKPKPRARSAAPVGNYAVQVEYTDGHSTGIYSFDYLRTFCPCDDCARTFRAPEGASQ